jgi:hypothetical protein
MTTPTPIAEGEGFSIASLARHLRMSRDTVAARLKTAQVKPCAERGGYPVFPLREACEVLLERTHYGSGERPDPASMKPMERRAWYQSENERLKFETECGCLIPADEVRDEMAYMAKIVVQTMETMPDVYERDYGPTPKVITYLIKVAEKVRAQIYDKLQASDPPQDDFKAG